MPNPHHGIADKLGHRPLMALEDLAHPLVVPAQHPLQRLRVQALAQRRRPCQVAEHHRDRLADLTADGPLVLERAAAAPAEPEPVRIPLTTRTAGHHLRSLLILGLALEQPLEAGKVGPQRPRGGAQQQWLGKTEEPDRPPPLKVIRVPPRIASKVRPPPHRSGAGRWS
jgi:hypothetical protein